MSNPKPMIVAVDDGYEYTKVVTDQRHLCLPTAVSLSPRRGTQLIRSARATQEHHYEIEGIVYAVGADVRLPLETRYDDFPFSPANLAVAIDAIRQAVPAGAAAHVVTGLPMDRFFTSSGDQRDAIDVRKMKAWS